MGALNPPPTGHANDGGAEVALARTTWQGVTAADLRVFMAAHAVDPNDSAAASLHWSDLIFAIACLKGQEDAHRELVQRVHAATLRAGGRIQAAATHLAEVESRLLQALLVGNPTAGVTAAGVVQGTTLGAPKLRQYRGRGSLDRWLLMAAMRLLLNASGSRPWEAPIDEALLSQLATDASPELAFYRERHVQEVRAALREAMQALDRRERSLLYYRFVEAVPLAALALMYGVHRATLTRWLAEARARLKATMQQRLRAVLKLGPAEVDSVVRLVLDQLDSSMRSLLRPESAAPEVHR